MLSWERHRENGYEAQRGWVLGEPLYYISRADNGQWHVYFRGEALAGTERPRPGQHYHTMSCRAIAPGLAPAGSTRPARRLGVVLDSMPRVGLAACRLPPV
jgi:hypothetical protein